MQDMGVTYTPATHDIGKRATPGEWLEYSPLLTIVLCVLGFGYLVREVLASGPAVLLQLDHYLFLFLVIGLLLHWRPKSFVQAISASVTPVGGVMIQYPMYAGIVRMLTESGLAKQHVELLRFHRESSTRIPCWSASIRRSSASSFRLPVASG